MSWKVQRADLVQVISDQGEQVKSAFRVARQIEDDIIAAAWPVHAVLGSEAELAQRYSVGRDTLREAVRNLGLREVAEMRRGPGGGLVVVAPSMWLVVAAFGESCRLFDLTDKHLSDARAMVGFIRHYTPLVQAGDAGVQSLGQLFEHSQLSRDFRAAPSVAHPLLSPSAPPSSSVVTDLFEACLDELSAPNDRRAAVVHNLVSRTLGHRGLRLVRALADEITTKARRGERRLGSEDDICERHDVSKSVLRQAVRILESRGLLRSQPGRSGGLMIGEPNIDSVIDLFVTYLFSQRLDRSEIRVPMYLTGKIGRQLAAQNLSDERSNELRRIWQSLDALNEKNFATPIRMEIDAIGNPIIEIFYRALLVFSARTISPVSLFSDDVVRTFHRNLSQRLEAIGRRDYLTADVAGDFICGRPLLNRSASIPTAGFPH